MLNIQTNGPLFIEAFNGVQALGLKDYALISKRSDWDTMQPGVCFGSVEFCEHYFGCSIRPDYYPEFLRDWRVPGLHYLPHGEVINGFVKSARAYKEGVCGVGSGYFTDVWVAPIVKYVSEWRLYVLHGRVMCGGTYSGRFDRAGWEETLKIDFLDWTGVADFGRILDSRVTLVECHHPYACGCYCKPADYVNWQIEAWNTLC